MEKLIEQTLSSSLFEISKIKTILKICLALLGVSTILVVTHSLIGNYEYALACCLSYFASGMTILLLKKRQYKIAKYWLFCTYSFLIILSAFLIGEASFASFLILTIPVALMVYEKERQRPIKFLLLAVAGFILCEVIITYTTPLFTINYPIINKFIVGGILMSVTFLILDLFKFEVLKKEMNILEQNELLKKEIGERIRIEGIVKEREERLQLAIETAELGFCDQDLRDGTVYCSKEGRQILGCKESDYNEESFLRAVHAEDRSYLENMIKDQRDGQMLDFEVGFRIYTEDRAIKWIRSVSKTVEVDDTGKPLRIINMFMDVTEQRDAQDRLEKKNLKLKQFSSVASHDMREPLRMICSFSQVLKRFNHDQLDDNGKEYLGFIEDASKRMMTMLDDLLQYARVGVTEQARDAVCLNNVLSLVQNNLGLRIRETNAEIKVASLPCIEGHQTFFMQIFQNLIANSLKFSKKNEAPKIDVIYKEMSKEHLFAVRDNGIGMEQSEANGIFKAFRRLHSRKEYEGSGLGLATCAELVETMNGRIWVTSELGVGSVFYISLPKEKSANHSYRTSPTKGNNSILATSKL